MKKFLYRHFPKSSTDWKVYFKIFLPIIAGSIMFAFNGVVDNFMVGHIEQGQPALGIVNSWTQILIGLFLGTAAAGSVVMAQFYHAKKFEVVRQVSRIRFLISFLSAILISAIAWGSPDILINTFLKGDKSSEAYIETIKNARIYIKIIAIQWILISLTFNYGNQLRELGYGKIPMFWGIGTLSINIILNSTLMYGFGLGVAGAAWASVAGRILAISVAIIVVLRKKIPIGINPLLIFKISWNSFKMFLKRWVYGLSIFTVTFFIIFRNYFYSAGYPIGNQSLGVGVSGLSVLALTGALVAVFIVTFNSLAAMSAVFVGSELGKGNIEKAKRNSDEIKGFVTTIAVGLSLLLVMFAITIPYMTFLSETKKDMRGIVVFDGTAQLKQVSLSLFVIALFYPIWIWFTASYRNGNAGGKGHWFAFVDWLITGPIQMGWLALITFKMVPNSSILQANFYLTYFLFFLSDFLKLVSQEILYYKYPWAQTITKNNISNKKITNFKNLEQ